LTTALTFSGDSPAARAASMPSSTRATGKSTSFIARNVASSSASRLTVARRRPAAASARAFSARIEPFVVRTTSSPSIRASSATSVSSPRRSSGSPPVSRTFRTPSATKARTARSVSSNVSTSERSRNAWSRPTTSFGMQ
jgi:hypothetical protein